MICPQGATFSKRLTWSINDVPVDLTGYTAKMQARDSYGAICTAVVDITTENGELPWIAQETSTCWCLQQKRQHFMQKLRL